VILTSKEQKRLEVSNPGRARDRDQSAWPQARGNHQPPGYQPDELQPIRGAADKWDLGPLSGIGSPAGVGCVWRTGGRRVVRFNASPDNGCGWPNPAMFGAVWGAGRVLVEPGELRFVGRP